MAQLMNEIQFDILQVFNRRVYIVKISIKHFTGGEIGENFISGKNSRQSFK